MLSPVAAEPFPLDRRQRRRQETIDEVLAMALEVMAEQGAAGLSLGEVARRMGIRTPSLYSYFDSKNALYDALFARGWQLALAAVQETRPAEIRADDSVEDLLLDAARGFVRWAIEHPAYSQLLFWRPVPGYAPTAEAYAPAVAMVEFSRGRFRALQAAGLLRADVPVEQLQRDWTVLMAGVVSQQLSNAPQESFTHGTFTAALPEVVAMFTRHYAPPSSSAPKKGTRHARKR